MPNRRLLAATAAIALAISCADVASAAPGGPTVRKVTDVKVGASPTAVAAAGGKVFVAVQGGNSVAVIDPATNTVIEQLTQLPQPGDIVAAADGRSVFVSTGANRSVTRIDSNSYRRTSYAVSGGGSLSVAPDGRYVLASPGGGQVARIGLNSGKVRLLPGTQGWNVQSFSPDGRHVYAQRVDFNSQDDIPEPELLKADTTRWKIRKITDITEDTDWSFAGDILTDPAGRWVYVSKQGDNNGFTGYSGRSVQRYSAKDLRPGRVYTVDRSSIETNVELGPQGLAFPDQRWRGRLAVANSNTGKISVIDVRSGAVTTRAADFGVSAVGYAGNRLYTANTGFAGDFPTTTTVFRVPGRAPTGRG